MIEVETTKFSKETLVGDVLEVHPAPVPIFEDYGVNPIRECGTNIYTIKLRETPDRCHVDDLDGLISRLNETLQLPEN